MLSTADYKTLTGIAVEEKTEAQIVAQMRTKLQSQTDAAIACALLAHYLLDVRNYKVSEASKELEVTDGTVSAYAAKGQVLHLAATPTTARTVWAQVSALSLPRVREMAQTLMAKPDTQRADVLQTTTTREAIAARLGDTATPEKVDAIAEKITSAGIVLPKKVREAVASIATELEIPLPKQERAGAAGASVDRAADKVPTPAEALAMLERFEQDREQGSDAETPFAVSDAEAGDLVAVALVAARVLRQANRTAEVIEAAALIEETLGMMTVEA